MSNNNYETEISYLEPIYKNGPVNGKLLSDHKLLIAKINIPHKSNINTHLLLPSKVNALKLCEESCENSTNFLEFINHMHLNPNKIRIINKHRLRLRQKAPTEKSFDEIV